MDAVDLEATYRDYVPALNDRRLGDLRHFVHDDITYNGEAMSRQQYSDLIAGDIRAIPDLTFQIESIVVQCDSVACRLWFECTPEHAFLGLEPTGNPIKFAEHVFYEFEDGRIKRIRSLIDRTAVEAQLRR